MLDEPVHVRDDVLFHSNLSIYVYQLRLRSGIHKSYGWEVAAFALDAQIAKDRQQEGRLERRPDAHARRNVAQCSDGALAHVHVAVSDVLDDHGDDVGLQVSCGGESGLKIRERKLRQAGQQLQQNYCCLLALKRSEALDAPQF